MHFWVGDRKLAICKQLEYKDGKGSCWLVSTKDWDMMGVCACVVYPDGYCPHWNLESHYWISLNLAHCTFQILSSTTANDCQMSLGRHTVCPTCCHSNDNALRCWSTLCVSPLLHYGLWISHQSWFARVWYRTPAAQETLLETSEGRLVIQLQLL